jgi:hypothetical protein
MNYEIIINIPVRVSVSIAPDGTRTIEQVLHVGQEDQPQNVDLLFDDFNEAMDRAVEAAAVPSRVIKAIRRERRRSRKPNPIPHELWRSEREARLEWALSDLSHVDLTAGVLKALSEGPKTVKGIVDSAFPGQHIGNVVRVLLYVLQDQGHVRWVDKGYILLTPRNV